jgi:hypothetical protein
MNTREELDGLPAFTGITTYRDPQGRFEFRYPAGWTRSELDDDLDGIIVRPEEDEQNTYFAVWISSLPEAVVASDLPELRAGFDDGLAQLTDLSVESAEEKTYGNIVKLERVVSFTDKDGERPEELAPGEPIRRKRRVWGMYVDTFQMVVVWQGRSVKEYDYWYPMGNYCFSMFKIPDELWFATDPEVNKAADPG